MSDSFRTTVYLHPHLHRVLKIKSAETNRSLSDLVNAAIRSALAEDLEDLASIDARADEPTRRFEELLAEMRDAGEI